MGKSLHLRRRERGHFRRGCAGAQAVPAAKFLTLKPYHEPISFPQTIHEIILRRQSEPIFPWVFPAWDCADRQRAMRCVA